MEKRIWTWGTSFLGAAYFLMLALAFERVIFVVLEMLHQPKSAYFWGNDSRIFVIPFIAALSALVYGRNRDCIPIYAVIFTATIGFFALIYLWPIGIIIFLYMAIQLFPRKKVPLRT